MKDRRVLDVSILDRGREVRVGVLVQDDGWSTRFHVDESYIRLGPERPILSTSWYDPESDEAAVARLRAHGDKIGSHGNLPPWFGNVLPEGALRDLVIAGMPTGRTTDVDVLEWVGLDLPGAVVVRQDSDGGRRLPPLGDPASEGAVRFSLAGVQPKMSMLKSNDRLTLPARSDVGSVIAKLPTRKYPFLPEVEFTTMSLAAAAGVVTPQFRLVGADDVEGLPEEMLADGDYVLAVDRFDRTDEGGRVHMEDFAQILWAVGDQKYTRGNDETVMKLAAKFTASGADQYRQAVTRVVANIMLGNTDAHLKNWSFRFPEPSTPELSPAYDLVSLYVYNRSDQMALRLQGTHDARIQGLKRFYKAAAFAGISEGVVRKTVIRTVEQARDLWPAMLKDLPSPMGIDSLLIERMDSLRVVQDVLALTE